MAMSRDEIFEIVKENLIDALGVEDDEVSLDRGEPAVGGHGGPLGQDPRTDGRVQEDGNQVIQYFRDHGSLASKK